MVGYFVSQSLSLSRVRIDSVGCTVHSTLLFIAEPAAGL